MDRYITYLRVSTQKQGRSGLGLEAQREMCARFVESKGGVIVNEFIDVESGKSREREALWEAIDYAKAHGIPLVIAKLDRLARDVEFTFKVMNLGIDIHFTDMPVVNTMILGVFASVAQYERELISARTKAALQAKKERGEVWHRNSDIIAASMASAKLSTDRAMAWLENGALPKYCRARWEQGWSFCEILEDAQKMYDVDPEKFGTRKGCRLNKCQLSKWIGYWRDMSGYAGGSEKEKRNR